MESSTDELFSVDVSAGAVRYFADGAEITAVDAELKCLEHFGLKRGPVKWQEAQDLATARQQEFAQRRPIAVKIDAEV